MKLARTDALVSSKKILALSWMPFSCCGCVPEPLMPEVALVELPVNANEGGQLCNCSMASVVSTPPRKLLGIINGKIRHQ